MVAEFKAPAELTGAETYACPVELTDAELDAVSGGDSLVEISKNNVNVQAQVLTKQSSQNNEPRF